MTRADLVSCSASDPLASLFQSMWVQEVESLSMPCAKKKKCGLQVENIKEVWNPFYLYRWENLDQERGWNSPQVTK